MRRAPQGAVAAAKDFDLRPALFARDRDGAAVGGVSGEEPHLRQLAGRQAHQPCQIGAGQTREEARERAGDPDGDEPPVHRAVRDRLQRRALPLPGDGAVPRRGAIRLPGKVQGQALQRGGGQVLPRQPRVRPGVPAQPQHNAPRFKAGEPAAGRRRVPEAGGLRQCAQRPLAQCRRRPHALWHLGLPCAGDAHLERAPHERGLLGVGLLGVRAGGGLAALWIVPRGGPQRGLQADPRQQKERPYLHRGHGCDGPDRQAASARPRPTLGRRPLGMERGQGAHLVQEDGLGGSAAQAHQGARHSHRQRPVRHRQLRRVLFKLHQ
mmetsp:Transcript_1061/g.1867  ORF Transcript_1061/g.1867 Transcript_1061/m.1867 type:complete len:323 (-) Transcript_1061:307-1275(-)